MPNFKSVVHFLLVDFGGGCYLVVVTGGKQNQLLVLGLSLEFDNKDTDTNSNTDTDTDTNTNTVQTVKEASPICRSFLDAVVTFPSKCPNDNFENPGGVLNS